MSVEIGQVLFSSPNNITVYVDDLTIFENNKNSLQVGNLLKIEDGNHNFVICSIENIGGTITNNEEGELWKFSITCMPIGSLQDDGESQYKFIRGGKILPVPTEKALLLDEADWELIYSNDKTYNFEIGSLSSNKNQKFKINGNNFFSKHSAIVGSTGSGKSCSVASLLQSVLKIKDHQNLNVDAQKNAHIIILDLHSEYTSAFKLAQEQQFNLNILTVDKIFLPYWLMNSEELESLFIESHEANSHNQISQFKNAVILNKKKHNPDFQEITYDTPVYFSINEVINFIRNKNKLTTYEDGEGVFLAVKNHKGIKNIDENLWEDLDFYPSSGNSKVTFFDSKVSSSDGFKGEFTRFVSRLETTLADKRLKFLLDSVDEQGNLLKTNDFDKILKQFLGYLDRSNVSILDLSAIPFEVISIVVSLVSRLLFDFSFHYSKIKHAHKVKNDIPILLVCEEAHIYLPRDEKIDYRASRKAIERIAKEGRKYGISLMVVSQRPSEVSDTILSQCSNFIALRLTNYQDQNYIKSLLPDSANTLVDMLPILSQGEAFIVGDSVILPSLIQFSEPNPSPQSGTVDVYDEWNKAWIDVEFSSVIDRWRS
ncbi:ATP-binding protein [Acinetobacter brisouii]|uniref:ATP-binding protein n=1 Tax=Acinetobacter brisouii TaxID=396323 RepID=UPI000B0D319A|nr:DUF87 domain-containing protein [Acinetobacter brisouii]